jgi:N-acetylmuramoyl-L-alanine amidase
VARDTGIAARLRAAGLRVVEVAGWQSRGSTSFNPRGSVNHHTAGGASGAAPSLNTCTYGRPGLSGPLCNVMQSREPGGNDVAYVVAAGRANHAGSGGWKGLSGNSSVYGLEIEHTGTAPMSEARQRIAARIHAAMFRGDPAMVCQHREWAPSRKIDAAEGVDPDRFRQWVREYQSGAVAPEGGFLMALTDKQQAEMYRALVGDASALKFILDRAREQPGAFAGLAEGTWLHKFDQDKDGKGDTPAYQAMVDNTAAAIEPRLAALEAKLDQLLATQKQ